MKYKYVYHVLDVDALLFTLKSNILQGKNYSGVSTSYDPKFNSYIGDRPWSFFKLQLDAQLLIQDGYNLKRFDYVSNNNQKFDEKEYHIDSKIQNIKKYITKIILIFSKFNSLKDAVFSQIGHQPNKFKEDIKWLYQNYKKDLYLQKLNHTFVKSDSFFQKIINKKIEIEYFGFEIYKKIEKYVKGNKDRMSHFEYEYIPFNKKNKILKNFVVGYSYKNLYLTSDLKKIPKTDDPNFIVLFYRVRKKEVHIINNNSFYVKSALLKEVNQARFMENDLRFFQNKIIDLKNLKDYIIE